MKEKKRKNNLYTLSYFSKRLRENGFIVKTLVNYSENDIRKWTIIIEPNVLNILCTCIKISSTNFYFSLLINSENLLRIRTESMEVIFNIINELKKNEKTE